MYTDTRTHARTHTHLCIVFLFFFLLKLYDPIISRSTLSFVRFILLLTNFSTPTFLFNTQLNIYTINKIYNHIKLLNIFFNCKRISFITLYTNIKNTAL
jgi:hypothetical protein